MIFRIAARRVRALTLPLMSVVAMAAPAWSQSTPAPTPAPTPTLIPGLENFSLQPGPGSAVTPPATPPPMVRTQPAPAPTSTASPTARPPVTPQPRATATPRAVPTPAPGPTATVPPPTPAPQEALPPVASAVPSAPVPSPTATPQPAAAPVGGSSWPLLAGAAGIALLLGGLAFWFLRRREAHEDEDGEVIAEREPHAHFDLIADVPVPATEPAAPPAQPSVTPPPEPPIGAHRPLDPGRPPKRGAHEIFDLGAVTSEPPAAKPAAGAPSAPAGSTDAEPAPSTADAPERATLDIQLRARRAGTNLLSAAVDYDIVVRNIGGAVAQAVQVDVRLLSAGAEQDGWIGTLFASPIERPITVPFDLPPQGAIELSGMAMMPKEMLSVMTVQGRALFVPVLAINLLYGWEGGTGQTAASHVVGIDRGEGAKMAPFRLDAGPRMHEGVTTLPYTVSVLR